MLPVNYPDRLFSFDKTIVVPVSKMISYSGEMSFIGFSRRGLKNLAAHI